MREYRLERTGDTLVRFSGELIAEGSSEQDSGLHSHSWHEIEIYETQDGKWIGHICFISGETARHDEYTAMVADSQDELRQQLLKYKHVGSNSYKFALSVALDDDDLLVEEIE